MESISRERDSGFTASRSTSTYTGLEKSTSRSVSGVENSWTRPSCSSRLKPRFWRSSSACRRTSCGGVVFFFAGRRADCSPSQHQFADGLSICSCLNGLCWQPKRGAVKDVILGDRRPRLLVVDEAWSLLRFAEGAAFVASMAQRAASTILAW